MIINDIVQRSLIEEIIEDDYFLKKQLNEAGDPDDPNAVPLEITALVGVATTSVAAILSATDNVPILNKLMPSAPTAEPPSNRQLQRTIDKLSNIPAQMTTFRVDGKRVTRVMYPIGSVNGPAVADFADRDAAARALNAYNSSGTLTSGVRADAVPDDKLPGRVRRWQRSGIRNIMMSASRLTSSIELKDWRANSKWFRILQRLARWGAPVLIVADFVDNMVWIIAREAENPEHGGDWNKIIQGCLQELLTYFVQQGWNVLKQLVTWWASVLVVAQTIKAVINAVFWGMRLAGLGTGPGAPFVWIASLVGQIGFSWWATTDSGQRALTSLWVWFLGYVVPGIVGDGISGALSEEAAEIIRPEIEKEWENITNRYSTIDSDAAEEEAPLDADGVLTPMDPNAEQNRPQSRAPAASTGSVPANNTELYRGFSFN